MGKIKKILETELVGGTQSTDVYPVTSTKAVYDENNVRLDTILKDVAALNNKPEDFVFTLEDGSTVTKSIRVISTTTSKAGA